MFRNRRTDGDFRDEVESHIELERDRLIAEGLPPHEALAAARRAFGNMTLATERFHESRRWGSWERVVQDIRYGLRSLRNTPAFTAAALLTIALGVGANTAVYSLMDSLLLRSLPVRAPNELVFVQAAGTAGTSGAPPYPCFLRLRAETVSFSGLAALAADELRVEIDGRPEQVKAQVASGNYFEVLGLNPLIGRLMNEDDERSDTPVAVISEAYWRRRFGRDPAAIGKTITFRDRPYTIIGVTPAEFWGLQPGMPIDLTLPITLERKLIADRQAWWFGIVARMKPGSSIPMAEAESTAVFHSFLSGQAYASDLLEKHFHHIQIDSAAHGMDILRKRFSKPLYALSAIVGLILLIAVANIANLLLARGMSRQREFAVRLAIGAGRARVVRQLTTETILLFIGAAIPGVWIAALGVEFVQGLLAEGRRPILIAAGLNWRVLGFALAVSFLAGLSAALLPAWNAFRTDAGLAIRGSRARTGESHGSVMLGRTLVAFQVAVSLVLLAGATTFLRTLANLRNIDPGFRNRDVLTMSLELPDGYTSSGRSGNVWQNVLESVRALPGVRSAAFSVFTPLSGRDRGAAVEISGYRPASFEDAWIRVNEISDGYFETLGIPLVRGRLPARTGAAATRGDAVINESAARQYFAGRDPVGQTIVFAHKDAPAEVYQVAGVVRDTKHMSLRDTVPRFVFIPIRQQGSRERRLTLTIAPASPGGLTALVPSVQSRIRSTHPELLISEVITVRDQLDATLLTERLLSGLSASFAVLALLLASVGLYGVLSYRIGQERSAIGIRIALGATPGSVVHSILRQSAVVILAGLAIGLPFAVVAERQAESMLWGVNSHDPAIYLGAGLILCIAGLVSAWIPARRASSIDPAESLRHE